MATAIKDTSPSTHEVDKLTKTEEKVVLFANKYRNLSRISGALLVSAGTIVAAKMIYLGVAFKVATLAALAFTPMGLAVLGLALVGALVGCAAIYTLGKYHFAAWFGCECE